MMDRQMMPAMTCGFEDRYMALQVRPVYLRHKSLSP